MNAESLRRHRVFCNVIWTVWHIVGVFVHPLGTAFVFAFKPGERDFRAAVQRWKQRTDHRAATLALHCYAAIGLCRVWIVGTVLMALLIGAGLIGKFFQRIVLFQLAMGGLLAAGVALMLLALIVSSALLQARKKGLRVWIDSKDTKGNHENSAILALMAPLVVPFMLLAIAYGAEWIGAVEVVIGTFSCMAVVLWIGNAVVAPSPSEADVFVSFDDAEERVKLVECNVAPAPETTMQLSVQFVQSAETLVDRREEVERRE